MSWTKVRGFVLYVSSELYFSEGFRVEILNPILKVEKPSEIGRGTSISGKHHPLFIKLLEDQLGCKAEDILDVELCFADFEPGRIGGCFDEYIFAPRLDNLCCCFASLKGLIDADETLQASRGYIEQKSILSNYTQNPILLEKLLCLVGEKFDILNFCAKQKEKYLCRFIYLEIYRN